MLPNIFIRAIERVLDGHPQPHDIRQRSVASTIERRDHFRRFIASLPRDKDRDAICHQPAYSFLVR